MKVPIEQLKLLEGEYQATLVSNWKIVFKIKNGYLVGNDGGYEYRLVPVGDNKFVITDGGGSIVFDTKDQKAITFLLFDKTTFIKVKQ